VIITAPALITGAACSFPPGRSQEELWAGFFESRLGRRPWARRAYASTGVRSRHLAVDPSREDISGWSTEARMRRWAVEAAPLGKDAVTRALARAGLAAEQVGLLAVVSCTGYDTPGIDIGLARGLAMAPDLQRLLISHVGCHAALPALGAACDFVTARRRPAVVLCVELCSLHVQPPDEDLDQVMIHSLFGDAACAVVVEPAGDQGGLGIVEVTSLSDLASADLMTWTITDAGFRMGLSRRVPEVLSQHLPKLVDDLLARHGLVRDEVTAWAVHPGGPRILDTFAARLDLSPDALDVSRRVLAERGNCSSATVLIVLEELRRSARWAAGDHVVAVSFGPGLTLFAALLRVR
jgi:predicted naringenin-chalcone synthase